MGWRHSSTLWLMPTIVERCVNFWRKFMRAAKLAYASNFGRLKTSRYSASKAEDRSRIPNRNAFLKARARTDEAHKRALNKRFVSRTSLRRLAVKASHQVSDIESLALNIESDLRSQRFVSVQEILGASLPAEGVLLGRDQVSDLTAVLLNGDWLLSHLLQ